LLLNVHGSEGTRPAAQNAAEVGIPGVGLMRYAFLKPDVSEGPSSPLLIALHAALRQKSQVGEVAQYLNETLTQKSSVFSSLTILSGPQKSRRISATPTK
jgi:hypothetical protein